jgi:hypothetical protein
MVLEHGEHYIPNEFFAILHTALAVLFIYSIHRSEAAKLIALQIRVVFTIPKNFSINVLDYEVNVCFVPFFV